jgi:hypothetical protein
MRLAVGYDRVPGGSVRRTMSLVVSLGIVTLVSLLPSSDQRRLSVDWPLHNLDLAGFFR